ncbi:MAG: Nuclease [Planctomycetaceae bacterium]|nr:Nuclease [Planctomycetaceae bacterium]
MRAFGIVVTLLLVLGTHPAQAWHNHGHKTVALIAWRQLGLANIDLQQRAAAILREHPHRDLFLKTGRPAEFDEDTWVFMQAATWPDWVRDPKVNDSPVEDHDAIVAKYHKGNWHFVNLPYINPNEKNLFDEAAIRKQVLEPELDPQHEPRHALAALKQSLAQLALTDTPPADKAVALCWAVHLIGDIHQPLHSVALIGSKQQFGPKGLLPPHGDNGGNKLAIRVKAEDPAGTDLHSLWDSLLVEKLTDTQLNALVHDWLQQPDFVRSRFTVALNKKDLLDWAIESRDLAQSVAYQGTDGLLKFHILSEHRDLNDPQIPALPNGYLKTAGEVAQRQMILGGYRLSDQLSKAIMNGESN